MFLTNSQSYKQAYCYWLTPVKMDDKQENGKEGNKKTATLIYSGNLSGWKLGQKSMRKRDC